MTNSVREITTAIASGDTEAFALFYRQWFDFALAEARRASHRDEQFCLDAVQETMMKVIRSIKPFEYEAALREWIRRVVHSCCYDLLRSQRRRQRREFATLDKAKADHCDVDLVERLAWLRRQLEAIGPAEAKLLTMRFRFGWTLERIARVLGLKPGAVDGRLTRSLALLRRQAVEDFNEE